MPQVVTKNVFSSFLLLHFGNLAGFIAKNCTEKISARQLVMCGIQAFNLRGLSPPSSTQQSKFTPKGKVMYTPGGNQRQSCKFTSSTWCAYWFTSFASFADTVYLAGLESINTFIILLGVWSNLTNFKYLTKKRTQQSIRILDPFLYCIPRICHGARRKTRPGRGRHNETSSHGIPFDERLAFTCMGGCIDDYMIIKTMVISWSLVRLDWGFCPSSQVANCIGRWVAIQYRQYNWD